MSPLGNAICWHHLREHDVPMAPRYGTLPTQWATMCTWPKSSHKDYIFWCIYFKIKPRNIAQIQSLLGFRFYYFYSFLLVKSEYERVQCCLDGLAKSPTDATELIEKLFKFGMSFNYISSFCLASLVIYKGFT